MEKELELLREEFDKKYKKTIRSDETRRKMSMAKQVIYEGENNPKASAVIQYNLKMKKIKEYTTIKEAVEKTGVTGVSMVCRGIMKSSKGYIFKYKE